jgi:hypothetical protein
MIIEYSSFETLKIIAELPPAPYASVPGTRLTPFATVSTIFIWILG